MENNKNISKEIVHFFGKLYSHTPCVSKQIEGLDHSPIATNNVIWLDSPVLEEEVHNVVFQLDKEKALGLMVFPLHCSKSVRM